MKKSSYLFVTPAVIGVVPIAGCGGGSGGLSSESTGLTGEEAGPSGAASVAEAGGLGRVPVDSEGLTVYELTEDGGATR